MTPFLSISNDRPDVPIQEPPAAPCLAQTPAARHDPSPLATVIEAIHRVTKDRGVRAVVVMNAAVDCSVCGCVCTEDDAAACPR